MAMSALPARENKDRMERIKERRIRKTTQNSYKTHHAQNQ